MATQSKPEPRFSAQPIDKRSPSQIAEDIKKEAAPRPFSEPSVIGKRIGERGVPIPKKEVFFTARSLTGNILKFKTQAAAQKQRDYIRRNEINQLKNKVNFLESQAKKTTNPIQAEQFRKKIAAVKVERDAAIKGPTPRPFSEPSVIGKRIGERGAPIPKKISANEVVQKTKASNRVQELVAKGYTATRYADGAIKKLTAPGQQYKSNQTWSSGAGKWQQTFKNYIPHELTFNAKGKIIREVRRDIYKNFGERSGDRAGWKPFEQEVTQYQNGNRLKTTTYSKTTVRHPWEEVVFKQGEKDYSKEIQTSFPEPVGRKVGGRKRQRESARKRAAREAQLEVLESKVKPKERPLGEQLAESLFTAQGRRIVKQPLGVGLVGLEIETRKGGRKEVLTEGILTQRRTEVPLTAVSDISLIRSLEERKGRDIGTGLGGQIAEKLFREQGREVSITGQGLLEVTKGKRKEVLDIGLTGVIAEVPTSAKFQTGFESQLGTGEISQTTKDISSIKRALIPVTSKFEKFTEKKIGLKKELTDVISELGKSGRTQAKIVTEAEKKSGKKLPFREFGIVGGAAATGFVVGGVRTVFQIAKDPVGAAVGIVQFTKSAITDPVGTAEQFGKQIAKDPFGTAGELFAFGKITSPVLKAAGKVIPKPARARIEVPRKGKPTIIRAVGFELGGRAVRLIGGKPKTVARAFEKLPEAADIKIGSPLETTILRKGIFESAKRTERAQRLIPIAQTLLGKTKGVTSKFITELPKRTERLSEQGTKIVLDIARQEGATVFGSVSRKAQTPKGVLPSPKDIDIKLSTATPEKLQLLAAKTTKGLKKAGIVARESKEIPGAVEVRVDGIFKKAVEFKGKQELIAGEAVPEFVVGLRKEGKPIKISGQKVTALEEELRGVTQGVLRIRRKKSGEIDISPPPKRMKDILSTAESAKVLGASRFFPSRKLKGAISEFESLFGKELKQLRKKKPTKELLADFSKVARPKGKPFVSPFDVASASSVSPFSLSPGKAGIQLDRASPVSPSRSPRPSPSGSPFSPSPSLSLSPRPSPSRSPFSPSLSPRPSPSVSPRSSPSVSPPSPSPLTSPSLSPSPSPSRSASPFSISPRPSPSRSPRPSPSRSPPSPSPLTSPSLSPSPSPSGSPFSPSPSLSLSPRPSPSPSPGPSPFSISPPQLTPTSLYLPEVLEEQKKKKKRVKGRKLRPIPKPSLIGLQEFQATGFTVKTSPRITLGGVRFVTKEQEKVLQSLGKVNF